MKKSLLLISSLLAAGTLSAFAADPAGSTTNPLSGAVSSINFGSYTGPVYIDGITSGSLEALSNDTNKTYAVDLVISSGGISLNQGYSRGTAEYIFSGSVSDGTVTDNDGNTVASVGNWTFNGSAIRQNYTFSGDLSNYSGNFSITASAGSTLKFSGTSTTAVAGTGAIASVQTVEFVGTSGTTYTVANSSIHAKTLEFSTANYSVTNAVRGNNASGNSLTISSGTTTFNGAVSNFQTIDVAGTLAIGSTGSLDLANATVTLSNAIDNSGTVTVYNTTIFDLSGLMADITTKPGSRIYTLISGNGDVKNWDSTTLTNANFKNGDVMLSSRKTVTIAEQGVVEISGSVWTMTYAGDTTGTWYAGKDSSTDWTTTSTTGNTYFEQGDNAVFDTAGANITMSGNIEASAITVNANTTFTALADNTLTAKTISVSNNSKLTVSNHQYFTWESATVAEGSTIEFDSITKSTNQSISKTINGAGTVIVTYSGTDHDVAFNLGEGNTFTGTLKWNANLNPTALSNLSSDATLVLVGSATSSHSIWANGVNTSFASAVEIDGTYGTHANYAKTLTFKNGLKGIADSSGNAAVFNIGHASATVEVTTAGSIEGALSITGKGTFNVGSAVTLGAGTDAATLTLGVNGSFSGTIGTKGKLVVSGSTVTLNGASGTGTIELGTGSALTVSTASTTGLLSATADSTLTTTKNLTATGLSIKSGVTLEKAGGEQLILSAPTFSNGDSTSTDVGGTFKITKGDVFFDWNNTTSTSRGSYDASAIKIDVEGGTFNLNNSDLTVGEFTLASGASLRFNSSPTNTSKLTITDDSTLAGTVQSEVSVDVKSGTTTIESTASIAASQITVESTGTLNLKTGSAMTFTTAKAIAGALVIDGTGTKVTVADYTSGTGQISSGYAAANLVLKNGGTLELTSANAMAATGDSARGFMVTEGKGTYLYSGTGDSYINAYSEEGYKIGISTNATLDFEVSDSAAKLYVLKVIEGAGALEKTGAGTLCLSGENTYSGGTKISKGTVIITSANALGEGTVTIDGGQLNHSSFDSVTLTNAVTIVLDSYSTTSATEAAIDGAFLTIENPIELSLNLVAQAATDLQFLVVGSGLASSFDDEDFILDSALTDAGYYIASYDAGIITLAIPEPSMFGLLAGTLALALAGTRRRRRGNAK